MGDGDGGNGGGNDEGGGRVNGGGGGAIIEANTSGIPESRVSFFFIEGPAAAAAFAVASIAFAYAFAVAAIAFAFSLFPGAREEAEEDELGERSLRFPPSTTRSSSTFCAETADADNPNTNKSKTTSDDTAQTVATVVCARARLITVERW